MSDYRTTDTVVVKRRGPGTTIAIVLLVIVVIVGLLFATGFWSANVTKSGALPEVSVKGGALPKVDMDSKEVVVGTSKTKVETETETVDVPTIGVKDNGEK
jgi:beta-lactam-binding protein with PASTA domain